jgi:hypothetical protein
LLLDLVSAVIIFSGPVDIHDQIYVRSTAVYMSSLRLEKGLVFLVGYIVVQTECTRTLAAST